MSLQKYKGFYHEIVQINHWFEYNDNIPTLEIRRNEYILVFDGERISCARVVYSI